MLHSKAVTSSLRGQLVAEQRRSDNWLFGRVLETTIRHQLVLLVLPPDFSTRLFLF